MAEFIAYTIPPHVELVWDDTPPDVRMHDTLAVCRWATPPAHPQTPAPPETPIPECSFHTQRLDTICPAQQPPLFSPPSYRTSLSGEGRE